MCLCAEVEEGEKKQLDLSILQVMDLDVPENKLQFSVLKAPKHGSIISYSADRMNTKGREEPIDDFTLQDLQNGTPG